MGILQLQLDLSCDFSLKVKQVGQMSNYQKRPATPHTLEIEIQSVLRSDRKVGVGTLRVQSNLTCGLFFKVKQVGHSSNYQMSPMASQMLALKSYSLLELDRKVCIWVAYIGSDQILTLNMDMGCRYGFSLDVGCRDGYSLEIRCRDRYVWTWAAKVG